MIQELYQLRGETRRMKYATCDHVGRLLYQRDQFDAAQGQRIQVERLRSTRPMAFSLISC